MIEPQPIPIDDPDPVAPLDDTPIDGPRTTPERPVEMPDDPDAPGSMQLDATADSD